MAEKNVTHVQTKVSPSFAAYSFLLPSEQSHWSMTLVYLPPTRSTDVQECPPPRECSRKREVEVVVLPASTARP